MTMEKQQCPHCLMVYEKTSIYFRLNCRGLPSKICRDCSSAKVQKGKQLAAARRNSENFKDFLHKANVATYVMLNNLRDLSHVPENVRHLYAEYRENLEAGEYQAITYHLN